MSANTESTLLSILPFMNSKVCQYFIRVFAAPRLGNTFIETKIIHLLKLPVPNLSDGQKQELLSKVTALIEIKKSDFDADVSELEDELNQLVYECYDLSDEEIQVIEHNI